MQIMCEMSANSNIATAGNLKVTDMSEGFTAEGVLP